MQIFISSIDHTSEVCRGQFGSFGMSTGVDDSIPNIRGSQDSFLVLAEVTCGAVWQLHLIENYQA